MSLIEILKDESAKWDREPPANEDAIRNLIEESRLELPEEYIAFLRYSNGGEGELETQPLWFRVWPAEEVIEANRDYEVKSFLPGYFGFGSSGGGDLLIFRTNNRKPWPVYMVDANSLQEEDVVKIADDFESFVKAMGRAAEDV